MLRKAIRIAAIVTVLGVIGAVISVSSGTASGQSVITLNPSTTYQTMNGWEATPYIGEPGIPEWPAFSKYKGPLLDHAVDLGINRLRLEVYPGVENNVDYFTQYMNGQITQRDWVHNYSRSPVNDDSDPSHINWAGFQFSSLDWTIDNVVVPMRQRLEARGEQLTTNLCFVSFGTSSTGFYQYNSPQEYAEFMLATFQHMQSKYGFVPDTIEVELEPENTAGFDGTKMGNAIKATIALLQANGFSPKYVVPSTTSMANSPTYFDAIAAVLGDSTVRQYVQEISYHRYSGVSDSALQSIASRSVQYGIGASMLEWWDPNNTYQTLQQDLTMGRNSAWQQNAILGIFGVDATDPNNPVITTPAATQFFGQYFQFVRKGAVRIGSSTTNGNFDPLAFINTDGRYVVVVDAAAGGSFSIQGLPAGSYGIKYTTSSQAGVDLPDVSVVAGQDLTASIPDVGVITVYAKTSSASATAVPATSTPTAIVATPTSVPPTSTATAVLPTATSVPPTSTPATISPTATSVPPTSTPTTIPPTATSVPPTSTPTESPATPTATSVTPTDTPTEPPATPTPEPTTTKLRGHKINTHSHNPK